MQTKDIARINELTTENKNLKADNEHLRQQNDLLGRRVKELKQQIARG